MTITSINTIDAKEQFSDLLNRVAHSKERIILTRRGKEIAAIISIEDLAQLEQKQSERDLEDAMDALKLTRSQGSISLEMLKERIAGNP